MGDVFESQEAMLAETDARLAQAESEKEMLAKEAAHVQQRTAAVDGAMADMCGRLDADAAAARARLQARRGERRRMRVQVGGEEGADQLAEMEEEILAADGDAADLAIGRAALEKQQQVSGVKSVSDLMRMQEQQETRLAAAEEAQLAADLDKNFERQGVGKDQAQLDALHTSLETDLVAKREALRRRRESRRNTRQRQGAAAAAGADNDAAAVMDAQGSSIELETLVLTAEKAAATSRLEARLARRRAEGKHLRALPDAEAKQQLEALSNEMEEELVQSTDDGLRELKQATTASARSDLTDVTVDKTAAYEEHSEALRRQLSANKASSTSRLEDRRNRRRAERKKRQKGATKGSSTSAFVVEQMLEAEADVLEEHAAASIVACSSSLAEKKKQLTGLSTSLDDVNKMLAEAELRLEAADEAQVEAAAEEALQAKLAENAAMKAAPGTSPDTMIANVEAEMQALKGKGGTTASTQRGIP